MSRKKRRSWNWDKPVSSKVELKQRVVFLDINGVLTSMRSSQAAEKAFKLRFPETSFKTKKEYYERLSNTVCQTYDPQCIELLVEFAKKNKAVVVISSTSRDSQQGDFIKKVLEDYGLKVGPALGHGCCHCEKGNEIKNFMWDKIKAGGQDYYVIFDDGLEFLLSQDEHLVRVEAKNGITQEDIDWAQEIFDKLGEPKWSEDFKPVTPIALLSAPRVYEGKLSPEEREQISFPGFGDNEASTKDWPIRAALSKGS